MALVYKVHYGANIVMAVLRYAEQRSESSLRNTVKRDIVRPRRPLLQKHQLVEFLLNAPLQYAY